MGIAHANTSDQADSNNANGTVIQDITLDTYGHIQTIGTTNLDTRYDDYSSWTLTADSGTNQVISSGNTVDIEGGTGISTVVSATDKVTVNLAKAYLLKAIQVSGSNNNPKLELDGSNPDSSDTVTLTGGTGISVTRNNDGQITFANTDPGSSVTPVTYDLVVAQTSGTNTDPVLRLNPSVGTNDDITFEGLQEMIVKRVSNTKMTIEHPTFNTRSISIDTSGADVLDTLSLTSNAQGHVTAASATKRTLTRADLGITNTATSIAVSYTHLTLPTNREV